ncbi:MAG: HlyD family efflux transporter periplasmic adaptor subunit, partial [Pseudomonadota bacterium]
VVLDVAKRSIGSVLREAEPLVTLVRLDTPVEAEVEIEAKDVGYVRAGDQARIKFEAFPFQRHGTLEGTVRSISEDVFAADPEGKRAPIHRARVAYPPGARLGLVPDGFRLIPGMAVTAEIKVGSRRVISYFLYPVFRTFDEAMREP